MSHRVLVLCEHLQRHLDRYLVGLEEHGIQVEAPTLNGQHFSEAELLPVIERFHGVIAGDDELTARVLERGRNLKVVSKWGIGLDAIDLAAAKRLGIAVFNTPGAFADEVADVAIGYTLLLARRLHEIDRAVRRGQWLKVQGVSLRGKRLGVIGVGSIGRAVVERGRALGMEVVGYDVVEIDAGFRKRTGLASLSLDELLASSDFVCLCCPLTPETRHLIDREALRRIKRGAYLVNTARGGLVDEAALIEALRDRRLAGAALDVYEEEPLPPDSPLRELPGVILGAHNASNTLEAVLRVNEMAIANLLRGLGIEAR